VMQRARMMRGVRVQGRSCTGTEAWSQKVTPGRIDSGLFSITAVVCALLLVLLSTVSTTVPASGQASIRTSTLSRANDRQSDEPLRVEVGYGGGMLILGSVPGNLLYSMETQYDDEHFEPLAELIGDRLELGVATIGNGFDLGRARSRSTVAIGLGEGMPMDLEVACGAGKAELDLTGLALTGLEIETGASQGTVLVSEVNEAAMTSADIVVGAGDFEAHGLGNLNAGTISVVAGVGKVTLGLGGSWRPDARVEVDMALGALELHVPEGHGLSIERDGFLAGFDSEGLIKRGDSYTSPNWDDARYRVRVELDASFGSVRVVWY